jgi:predicted RecB family endonuclease
VRGRASVEIAKRVLEKRGCTVIDECVRIRLNSLEVGEVDLLAKGPSDELLAVEVKAGGIGVSELKQLYVNALILNAKPVAVVRSASDEAKALASRLGIELVELNDLLAVDEEELYSVVKSAVEDTLFELLTALPAVSDEQTARLLEAVVQSENLEQAARIMGIETGELEKRLRELRKSGLLPPLAGYGRLKAYAKALLALRTILATPMRKPKDTTLANG